MKKSLFFLIVIFSYVYCFSQNELLDIKVYGESKDIPLIFLHGGPGYNSVNFELTTAQLLAEEGFYVIVYDRRGEGRESSKKSDYNFKQTCEDLNSIYNELDIKKAHLLGHSFGGIVATKFALSYTERVFSITLLSSPISFQTLLKTIIHKSEDIYIRESDSVNLQYVKYLKGMDSYSLNYAAYVFQHALLNRFYSTDKKTKESEQIYEQFKSDSLFKKYMNRSDFKAVKGFYDNEKYTSINLENDLLKLKKSKVNIYGIYGKEDGLFNTQDIKNLREVIGEDNVSYIKKSSHNVYIDQQKKFFEIIKNYIFNEQ